VTRQGKLISATIADNFDRMLAAASKDGVQLRINNSYRSPAEQVRLYNLYKAGKGAIAAKPGTSLHEKGLAIDFVNTPGAYAWLKKNASKFGLHNFPPEPWHYSTTGG
jgi:LAS superfamily LD-carboxypeptidase LdcB